LPPGDIAGKQSAGKFAFENGTSFRADGVRTPLEFPRSDRMAAGADAGVEMLDPDTIRSAAERNIQLLKIRPGRGLLTGKTTARVVDGLRCEIEDGTWRLAVDMPAKVVGQETAPTPGVLGRGALASCLAIGVATWGARLGVTIDAVEVEVEAYFDARWELGLGEGVVPGYTEVRYQISIDSPAPADQITELLELAERHSPYLDVFGRAVPLRRAVRLKGREA
jgi:uncharacterized OsmC-like protein